MMTVVCFSQRVHFLGHDNSACSPDSDSSGGWGGGGVMTMPPVPPDDDSGLFLLEGPFPGS